MDPSEKKLGEVFVAELRQTGILSELITFPYEPSESAPLEDLPLGWPVRFSFHGQAYRRVGYNPAALQVFYISESEHTERAEQWFAGGGGI